MKKINLIEWLWKTDSHEKQKVRGMQKYCILLLLLLTCVTHAYAYYITGSNDNLTGWGTWQSMTVSSDGYYEYFTAARGNCECKINTIQGYSNPTALEHKDITYNFNSTNLGSDHSWGNNGDNINFWYHDGDYYIICYYPNTSINSSSSPIVCASTTLPDDTPTGPSVSLEASPTSALCGENITFTATPSNLGGASATYTFTDITGGGSTIIRVSGASASCTHSWTTAGTKTVRVTMAAGGNNYTANVNVTIKNCYVRGTINSLSWNYADMSYATDGAGVGYFYYQVTSIGWFKVLEGEHEWEVNSSTAHQRAYSSVRNTMLGANITLTDEDGDYHNIGIGSTGYIIYYASKDSVCATTDRSLLGVVPDKSVAIGSVSPSSMISGNDVTITATRTNTSNTITLEYTDDSGSHWYSLTPKSSSMSSNTLTATWTIPVGHGNTKTYNFRAKVLADELTSAASSNVKAYGIKTIKVKDTNGWGANFKIHRWGGDASETTYPGETANITSAGGQWKQVVLYSSNTGFLFCNGPDKTTADGNKTSDQTYDGVTDGECYAIASGSSGSLGFSTTDCPSAPSVTTATATSVAAASVKFNASGVSANNDAITAYGFYWGTTDACTSGPIAASNLSSTTFSITKSSLTNGTTYFFKAYATNGQGTTYGEAVSVRTKFVTTVTLNQQGGSGGTTSVSATEGSAMPSGKTAPGKTGYTFGGYYTSAGGGGTQYYSSSMTSAHAWDVAASTATIHAKWTANTWYVRFNANSGTGSMDNESFTYDASAKALTTNTFTRTGYAFQGWATSQDDADAGIVIYADKEAVRNLTTTANGIVDLYAVWEAETYTVSFDVNGGTASTPSSKEVTYDAAYGTLPGGMTHASKQFIGWYTDPDDGEGDLITAETIVSTASDHTLYAHYENVYSVNVNFKCGEASIYPSTSVEASPTSLRPTITAPEVFGYSFVNWTGSSVTFADASSATTTITATAATSVTANYAVVPTVYFKNNLGWENVYVTFDSYWKEVGGKQVPGNNGKPYYKMSQLGSSDVFYCPIPEGCVSSWKWNIAFDNTGYGYNEETHIGTYDPFYEGEFTGRGDFDQKATMFIPYNGDTETRNSGTFYKSGCWMKYNSTESGYQVKMNEYVDGAHADLSTTNLTAPTAGGYEFSAKVSLGTANYSYGFKLYKPYQENTNDLWYTNTGDITSATDNLPWAFWSGSEITADTRRCGLHTEALGDYKITVSFATGKPMVSVEYPVSTGDWKLIYKDLATWSGVAHTAIWNHPSRVIKAKEDAEDIVSFYVAYGSTPSIELHKCTAINPSTGAQTWEKQGADLDLSDITATGIYNFKVTQDGSKNATAAYDGEYEGNFYIRTDASDGGWTNYKSSGKNLMTYSEYSLTHGGDFGPYSHYFMRFASKGTNIKFCIANEYSEAISDTVVSDTYTNEYIDADGNVRFMWNSGTNKIGRTYISGSSIVSDRFLVLEGDEKMYDENGNELTIGNARVSGLNEYEMNFGDDQNWIYEATVKAQPGARIKLTAKYNNKIQYFYGEEGDRSEETTELLLGGSGTDKYKVRVVYDFKTNRLMRAFIPDGTITTDLAINADMMIIREHQQDAQQISFSGSGALSEVKTVYGAMKFNKYTVNGKEKTGGHAATGASRYERDLFYISFPFDVKLGDVFGFGTYGQHWIIEYYDGKTRAAKGFWADSDPNWKFVMPSQRNSFTMKAFEGYILALELDEMTESSSIWDHGVEDVYVYFPSDGDVKNIAATNRQITIDQTGYECKINRNTPDGNRTVKDSYWHCIGVPSFADYSRDLTVTDGGATIDWSDDDGVIDWTTPSLPYLYEWNSGDNSLSVTTSATFDFKATWSYLVQYAGTSIYWSQVNVTPASIVARKRTAPTSAEFRIELQKDGQKADQTFVRLTEEENVTTGFDFNYDLSKEFNKNKPNIYSLVTTVKEGVASVTQSAANVLPMTEQTTVIPVGVKIATAGDYTFAIPEGTNGVGVTLIDNETGVRTNLSALDYTINLSAGTYDERFVLEISPIMQTPTGIEQIGSDDANGARKMLIDGVLYIVKDGKIFDAQGRQVK